MKSKVHRISIPSILETGPRSTQKIGALLQREGLTKIALFYDEQIKNLFGEQIETNLKEHSIEFESIIIDTIEFCTITEKAFTLSGEVNGFVALGGGKVLDAAKYMAFLRKLPFISIPTSTSNDGFSSPVCSLLIKGRRTTVPARIPYGIIVDTEIVSSAPEKFIYSGIGDLVSNMTALWDWKFEEKHHKAKVDDFAVMISQKAVHSFINLSFKSIKEQNFLQELVDSLTMNGIAMEISSSSAPASGSEHLISHALDKLLERPYLHGVQVGVAAYLMSQIQQDSTDKIHNIFERTGFWSYVSTLEMQAEDFIKAIDLAPSIKAQRYTVIHIEENRSRAKDLIKSDPILQNVLK